MTMGQAEVIINNLSSRNYLQVVRLAYSPSNRLTELSFWPPIEAALKRSVCNYTRLNGIGSRSSDSSPCLCPASAIYEPSHSFTWCFVLPCICSCTSLISCHVFICSSIYIWPHPAVVSFSSPLNFRHMDTPECSILHLGWASSDHRFWSRRKNMPRCESMLCVANSKKPVKYSRDAAHGG